MANTASSGYIVIIPAYNEAASIGAALESLVVAATHTARPLRKVIVCLNGCTDDTARVVGQYATKLPVTTITSAPGYIHAMNRLLGHARRYYPQASLIKVDADSVIAPNAIGLLLDQFDRHPELVVAGGHPLPRPLPNLTSRQRLLARLFSLRSVYPLAEVAATNVAHYHKACYSDPQPGIGLAELRLKTHFHGRLWAARTSSHLTRLADGVIGDDVFLTVWLYSTYGQDAIRVIYAANTYSPPNHSLRRHWMVYKRIHEDKNRTSLIPEYTTIQALQRKKLSWRYILTSVPIIDALLFVGYAFICAIEEFTFNHTAYHDKYWQYTKKEV